MTDEVEARYGALTLGLDLLEEIVEGLDSCTTTRVGGQGSKILGCGKPLLLFCGAGIQLLFGAGVRALRIGAAVEDVPANNLLWAVLLHDVCELMRDQRLAGGSGRCVLSSAERDVVAESIGAGADSASRLGCGGVRMHAHLAEVATETRLEEAASGGVERLAAGAQHVLHGVRHGGLFGGFPGGLK